MKKEYISPETAVTKLNIETAFCLSRFNGEGNGEQLGKKNFDDDDDDSDDYWD